MATIEMLQRQIDAYEIKLAGLRKQKREAEEALQNERDKTAYQNAIEAAFDGLKFVADREKPFALSMPMYVQTNMFYTYEEKLYVCIKSGIVEEGTFAEYLEADEL